MSTQAGMFFACSSPLQQESENVEYNSLADSVKWAFDNDNDNDLCAQNLHKGK